MLHDLRHALRLLFKSPGQTVAIVLILALGLGANTAIFSVVYGVVLRPLPYPEPERLVVVRETQLPQFPQFSLSPPNYLDFSKASSFAAIAAIRSESLNLLGRAEPLRLIGAKVSPAYFRVYGTPALLGRWLHEDEDKPGADQVVVLGYGVWQRLFAGDPAVLGQSINLSGRMHTIVGVMPASWRRDSRAEIYVPMAFGNDETTEDNRGSHYIGCVGRLKPGVSRSQADAELKTIAADLALRHPGSNKGWSVFARDMTEDIVGDARGVLYVLLGAVVCVLLIACANVANLLLARATARAREFALRAALGAGRLRLVRQLLTESLLLSVLGGLLGLLLARWGLDALLAAAPSSLPRAAEIDLNGAVLAFNAAAIVATGLVFGLAPAWLASRFDLSGALKDGARGSGGGRRRLRNILVAGEVALSFVLLIGAGLLIRSFVKLSAIDPGFDPRDATVVAINRADPTAPDDPKPGQFATEVAARMRMLPGVVCVGLTQTVPMLGDWVLSFYIDGRPRPAEGEEPSCNYYSVTPDYFPAMRIRLVRGRLFSDHDNAQAPPVVIVSESFAKQHFPNEDALGRRIYITNGPEVYREIVGIVADVKQYGIDRQSLPQAYDSYYQKPSGSVNFIVRTDGPAQPAMLQGIRPQVFAVDRNQPVAAVRPLSEIVGDTIAQRRFAMLLLGCFAAVALLIAAVGIYAVMSFGVTQRTSEIGIRMALGAQHGDVLAMILRDGLRVVGAGLMFGVGGALALGRIVESQLYATSARDPLTFAAIVALLLVVTLLACLLPARRAARVDPLTSLRAE